LAGGRERATCRGPEDPRRRQADPNATGVLIDPDAEEVQQLKSAAMPLLFQLREEPEARGAPARPPDRSGEGRRADLAARFQATWPKRLNPGRLRARQAPRHQRGCRLACDVAFGDRAVAAGSFRLIERAIAPLDHLSRSARRIARRRWNSDARYLPRWHAGSSAPPKYGGECVRRSRADIDRGRGSTAISSPPP